MKSFLSIFFIGFLLPFFSTAQISQIFTRGDSLVGSNTPGRSWWDVKHYAVRVEPDFESKTIKGKCVIRFSHVKNLVDSKPGQKGIMQIDLQEPLVVDSITVHIEQQASRSRTNQNGSRNGDTRLLVSDEHVPFKREGNAVLVNIRALDGYFGDSVTVYYHGKPKEATNPPWDGGWVWQKDKQGRPWMSVACEGEGASLWFPCKDFWADEPDEGATLTIVAPNGLTAVGNGRLKSKSAIAGKTSFTWEVKSPINAYNIIPYIGHYTSWSDTLQGEKGKLDLTYWVLDYEVEKAKKQFAQVKSTLRAFEYWFGAYPFYSDGYQLVQSPYLGMEHQSAVAYGNQFENGYLGTDLSRTGWGLKWDYIIVHETGHEWFGNNITAADRADMWIQEAFTTYSEPLFTQYYYGTEAANQYTQGLRSSIQNDQPIIAAYGVNKEGSGDMYFKGANLIHTIRQIINDDKLFRRILRGLNRVFFHKTVTSKQIEDYISEQSGINFSKVFDQYLRTAQIPVLEINGNSYRWTNCIGGFAMPVRLQNGKWIRPTTSWKKAGPGISKDGLVVDPNFYIVVKK